MIVAKVLSSALISKFTSVGIVGQKASAEALAISSGVSDFLMMLSANATCTGPMGTGSASGNFIIPPALGQIMVASFSSYGLVGSASQSLAYAIGSTISEYVSSSGLITAPTIVGSGSGTANFTAVPSVTLYNFLLVYFSSLVGDGEMLKSMSLAIADGVCTSVLASASPLTVVGTPQYPFSVVPSVSIGIVS